MQSSCFNFQNNFCRRFLSKLKKSCFVRPNCGFNVSTRASKYLNGSARPYWRIMLVWKITIDVDNNNKEFWTAVLMMLSELAVWPYYMANYSLWGQCQDVYVVKNVQIVSYMCAACHAFIPFCSKHPEILTVRALLNGDQLCGHVYIAWPNYSNYCCRQQIMVSWD